MKKLLRNIHLYLSLSSGLVIMVTCLTGAVLVFEKELQQAFFHDRYYANPLERRVPLEEILTKLRKNYPEAKVAGLKIYKDPARTVEAGIILPSKDKAGRSTEQVHGAAGKHQDNKRPAIRATHTAVIDPYSGDVVELYVYRKTFFYKVFALHRWLLGSNSGIGKYIVGVSTFIFMFILLTGILLWWPKTKKILVQRLKIKADSGWKRLNHDIHIVTGFYSAIFLLVFAFTAMSWSFSWFNKGIYTLTGSPPESPQQLSSVFGETKNRITADEVYAWSDANLIHSDVYNIRLPKDSGDIIAISAGREGSPESQNDTYYMNQYTGKILGATKYKDKTRAERVRAYIKPLHTGSIFGMPSKIIAFITCLFGASFPVTGTIMWMNRLRKGRKPS